MKHVIFGSLSSLLVPLGAQGSVSYLANYQRSYLSSAIGVSTDHLLGAGTALPRELVAVEANQLDIQSGQLVRELVVIDSALSEKDKSVLRRTLKPSAALVEISAASPGLPQLIAALSGHKDLAAIHIVSHAEAGALLLRAGLHFIEILSHWRGCQKTSPF